MQPVLILQHLSTDGPAYLASWLRQRGVPLDLRNTEAGDAFPDDIGGHAALAILGGEMSANDALPSLRRAEALVLQAMARGIPVIGHCLGGQLMARALGARIVPSPAPEVGWQPLQVLDTPTAHRWFGAAGERQVFQWHYEAFELPLGVERLAGSAACPNQAFARGPHLAMQFHIEVDAEKLSRWVLDEGERYRSACLQHPGSVQTPAAMQQGITQQLAEHHALADRLYSRWLDGLFPV
ncbi:MAG: type 1 glutamine amidotransferase [Rubrivivax sp.]